MKKKVEDRQTYFIADQVAKKLRPVIQEMLAATGIQKFLPANHRAPWTQREKDKLYYAFSAFVRARAEEFGRSPMAIRIGLMRVLKEEKPDEWKYAGRD